MSFTAAEQDNLLALLAAGRAIRAGLGNSEAVLATATDRERWILGKVEHALTEVDEGVVLAWFYLVGVAAERDDRVRDALRAGPRSAYLEKAFSALDRAVYEAEFADAKIIEAATARRDDIAYQLQLSRAKFQLSKTVNFITAFDRTLQYAEPDPDAILILDQFYQSAAQYGYDIAPDLLSAWNEGPLLPSLTLKAIAHALSRTWLFQGQVMAAAGRTAGLDTGDGAREASLNDLLQDAPQYLHVVQVSLNGLDTPAGNPERTLLRLGLTKARTDLSDAWRHLDFGSREVAR